MAWLVDNNPDALEEFLTLHLLPWAPHMLQEMEEAAEHPFFRGLAGLTRASLEGIRDALSLSVTEPRFYR